MSKHMNEGRGNGPRIRSFYELLGALQNPQDPQYKDMPGSIDVDTALDGTVDALRNVVRCLMDPFHRG